MEAKLNTIEAMFTKTEADLNYALRRLDDDNAKADEEDQSGQPNPVRLAQSLDSIRSEFTSLREEAMELEKMQREAAGVLQKEMANLTMMLMQMQGVGGAPPPSNGESSSDSSALPPPPNMNIEALEAELTRLTDSLPAPKRE